jgi:hypothetical protein
VEIMTDTLSSRYSLGGGSSSANPQCAESTLKSFDTMMADPVACGFFRQFAKRNFCAENLDFYVAVQLYKDKHALLRAAPHNTDAKGAAAGDDAALPSAYRVPTMHTVGELERNTQSLSTYTASETGTSSVCSSLDDDFLDVPEDLSNEALRQLAVKIYHRFVSDDSPEQVSLSAVARKGVEQLTNNDDVAFQMPLGAYDVAMKEIKLSLKRDMFRRFKEATEFQRCQAFQQMLENPPPVEKTNPMQSIVDAGQLPEDLHFGFSLKQILNDRHMYSTFYEFLNKRHCAENLLCWRYIQIYKLLYHRGDEENVRRAGVIYSLFIHENARYEVSVRSIDRNQIGYRISQPTSKIFRAVERACYHQLRVGQFPLFKASGEYISLRSKLQTLKDLQEEEEKQNKQAETAPDKCCVIF